MESRFTTAAAYVTVVALVGAFAGAFLDPTEAFRGSVTASALVGLVFAGYNAYTVRESGTPRFATSVIVTVFGLWLTVAPLTYPDVNFAGTAAVQFSGMLVAAFGGHLALDAVEALVASGTAHGD